MRRLTLPSLLTVLTIGGLVAVSCVPATAPHDPGTAGSVGCSVTRVIDGDTIDMACHGIGPFRARLAGFDTPETFEPGCTAEARAGAAATDRLRTLVRQAATVEAQIGNRDRYDRRLVVLRLDGREVGQTLIAEGLAVPYSGGRRIDWCARLT